MRTLLLIPFFSALLILVTSCGAAGGVTGMKVENIISQALLGKDKTTGASVEETPVVTEKATKSKKNLFSNINLKVKGDGSTKLENTVIRWYIESTPRGADVFTRVISSTDDVKNSNQNYVGSTPYETTEAFDIKGLSLKNAGDVQIEVTCEKAGYITQKKRFNILQAIDQKEISTKFNLVKE